MIEWSGEHFKLVRKEKHWRALLNTNHKIYFFFFVVPYYWLQISFFLFCNLLIIAIDTAFNVQFYYCHANVRQHVCRIYESGIYVILWDFIFMRFWLCVLLLFGGSHSCFQHSTSQNTHTTAIYLLNDWETRIMREWNGEKKQQTRG